MSKGEFSSDMVFYAFRYCLGRHTGAVNTCVDYLIRNWEHLNRNDRQMIVDEIREAMNSKTGIGVRIDDTDKKEWLRIIDMDNLTVYEDDSVKEKRWRDTLKVCAKCSKGNSVHNIVTNGKERWCVVCGAKEGI